MSKVQYIIECLIGDDTLPIIFQFAVCLKILSFLVVFVLGSQISIFLEGSRSGLVCVLGFGIAYLLSVLRSFLCTEFLCIPHGRARFQ